ncbi:cytochrome b/b6 domain-containing protein [uncultured Campylobacter sp.]|uniref:cytochrome b/b6 domain-containing protein n=1 Tax=uncultured Campylobacter sp. TaxID=218934 RepID=UPI00261148A3|nr:cytochrome b/b6 domain-containing protein [uncultured Campylobacter sp.]
MKTVEDKVLKFPLSERVFHFVNMVTWLVLAFSGIIVYFKLIDVSSVKFWMDLHIWVGALFTVNFVGFVLLNFDRFFLMMRNLLIWDKDTIAWFKNFGGYPKKILNINFGPEEVAPQGRFNAGQKGTYLFFIFMIFALIVSGWILFVLAPVVGKNTMVFMFYLHVWGSIIATAVALFGHLPMALLNMDDFKAMFGNGEVPMDTAKEHSPKWVEQDLVKTEKI